MHDYTSFFKRLAGYHTMVPALLPGHAPSSLLLHLI